MLLKTMLLFALIATSFSVPAFADSSPLLIKDLNAKLNFAIAYTATGISVNSITGDTNVISIVFDVSVTESIGEMSVTLPRNIMDAKIGDEDDDFFILADGDEIKFEEEKLESSRILSFSVPEGTEEIEIFGTILLGESFILELQEKLKQEEEKAQILTQEEFEAMQREAIINYFEEQKAEEQALEQEYIAQEAWEKEQEDKRLDFLISSCGEGTVYEDDIGCVAVEKESVETGPLINAIFAAMGIGLATMIILWGIGKKRGHKKLSIDGS